MSSIFILQVITGREAYFCLHAEKLLSPEFQLTLVVPKREMWIRKLGKMHRTVKPIFPGYVCITAEAGEIPAQAQRIIKRCPGYIRFLNRESGMLRPVSDADQQLIKHLISHGDVAGLSKVTFDKNKRIRALSGPLKGCEGLIFKVDRRKRRAKVKFLLNGKTFIIDFQYEELELVEPGRSGS